MRSPGVPVKRTIFEDDEASSLSLIDELAVEAEINDTRDPTLLVDGDRELSVGENKVAADRASFTRDESNPAFWTPQSATHLERELF